MITRRHTSSDIEMGVPSNTGTDSASTSSSCFASIIDCVRSNMTCVRDAYSCIDLNVTRCCYRFTTRHVRNCLRLSFAGLGSFAGAVISSSTWTVGALGTNGAVLLGGAIGGGANLASTFFAYENPPNDHEARLVQLERNFAEFTKQYEVEEEEPLSEVETENFSDIDSD